MRRALSLLACLVPVALGACSDSTGTTVRSATGSWRSYQFADAEIAMTLVETARATTGAGHWISGEDATAFRVTGAHASSDGEDRVSLLLDFDGAPDVDFHGRFDTRTIENDRTTVMAGRLYGAGFRGDSIEFIQVTDRTGS